jgi:hypothetical protein
MPHPLDDLTILASALDDLNMVQSWIDHARLAAPTNPIVQAELDHAQADLDYKRARVTIAMDAIRHRN